jgi:uncharacterized protein (TIGR02594 family)
MNNSGRCHKRPAITAIALCLALLISSETEARPRLWCGWWLAHHLGYKDRNLYFALNWLADKRFMRVDGPAVGQIAVFRRGNRGGHVGIVKGVPGPGKVLLLSGNDGNAVRLRERSTARVIGYVVPAMKVSGSRNASTPAKSNAAHDDP